MNNIPEDIIGGLLDGIEWVVSVLLVLAAIAACIAAIVIPIAIGVNHSGHVSCLRLHEQSGLPTRYARSGVDGECWGQVNGSWVPEDRWRVLDGDN